MGSGDERICVLSPVAQLDALGGSVVGAPLLSDEAGVAVQDWAEDTLRSISDAIVTVDFSGRITFLNTVAEHLTGWNVSEAKGMHFAQVVPLRSGSGDALSAFATGDHHAYDFPKHTVLIRRDRHEVPVEGTVAPIVKQDRCITGSVAVFRNVTQARRAAAALSYQASHDSLTGLFNRKAFERSLGSALEKATEDGSCQSLLYLDLDQFKIVNDTGGHVAGDALLHQLAGLLKAQLRESDHIARLGGDEFGVLLENCRSEEAVDVAEKLRRTVADFTFVWEQNVYSLGVSIGIVHFDHGRLTREEILSCADEACYVAKSKGRNTVHVYEAAGHLLAHHHSEMEWTSELKAALAEDRLFLCAQNIARVADPGGLACHIEILLRMRSVDGATILPMAFIPAAERHGLIAVLDRWVVSTVLEHMATMDDRDVVYCINLSGASISDDTFPRFVANKLSLSGVDGHRLCFEITETVAVANLTDASRIMGELKLQGIRFALDDFGSGLSSFAYLRQLPLDYLKIDGSFVQNIASQRIDRGMVESINHLAHVMGMKTIAEWVSNDQTLGVLQEIGVDFAQGSGVATPQRLR